MTDPATPDPAAPDQPPAQARPEDALVAKAEAAEVEVAKADDAAAQAAKAEAAAIQAEAQAEVQAAQAQVEELPPPPIVPLPVLSSLRGYRRSWLGPDLLAALTLLVIGVPEQLATSRLAGMPPVTGLYAFVAGSVLFAVVGSNRQMSVGADSTIAPLFAAGVATLAPAETTRYAALVGVLAVEVGVLLLLVGVLRLGWIVDLLSVPIVTGFMAGVAIIIVVHQLPALFGLPESGGSTLHRLGAFFTHLGNTSGWTLGIGLGVLAVVSVCDRVDRRIPGALIAAAAATVLVAAAGLHAHGVAVVGTIAHGAPRVGLRQLTVGHVARLAPTAAVVAVIVITQTAATTRSFADQGGYDTDVDMDMAGVGAANVAAGLFGAFPVDASPGRTAAVAQAGGRTQLTSLATALAVVALVPALAIVHDLPEAALAAILVFIASRLFHWRDLVSVARFDRWELALALITLLTVALVGVGQGIGVALGLAFADRTRRSARPVSHVLGRIPGTTSWMPFGHHEQPQPVPGVVVFLFDGPVYFANADFFRQQVHAALRRSELPVRLFVLDAAGYGDIDYTGVRTLVRLLDELEQRKITVAVARALEPARRGLNRSGLMERIGRGHIFHTVDEAVEALAPAALADTPGSPAPPGTPPPPGTATSAPSSSAAGSKPSDT